MKPSRLRGSDRFDIKPAREKARIGLSRARVRRREESEKEVSRSLVTAATAIAGAVVGVDSPGTSKVGEFSAETNLFGSASLLQQGGGTVSVAFA